jgi:carbamoyl-phosphate synthase large subunit
MRRLLITGAGGPGAVNLTRSLLAAPEKMFLLGCDASPYYIHLALTEEKILVPKASDEKKYIQAINAAAEKYSIDFIFPGNSIEMEVLKRNEQKIQAKMFVPRLKTLEIANNKYETYLILKAKSLPVPFTMLINSMDDLESAFSKMKSRPVWIRGAGIPGRGIGGASLPCRTLKQADGWIDYYNGWGGFIASEYLSGDNLTWLGIFKNGKLVTSQGRKRIAYVIPWVSPSGITGAPAVSHTVHDERINLYGQNAVLALDHEMEGVAFVDFKCDNKGVPRITEINAGRFGTTIHFYTAAGVNFPYILLKIAFGEDYGDIPDFNPLPENLYWIRTLDCGPVLVKKEDIEKKDFEQRFTSA